MEGLKRGQQFSLDVLLLLHFSALFSSLLHLALWQPEWPGQSACRATPARAALSLRRYVSTNSAALQSASSAFCLRASVLALIMAPWYCRCPSPACPPPLLLLLRTHGCSRAAVHRSHPPTHPPICPNNTQITHQEPPGFQLRLVSRLHTAHVVASTYLPQSKRIAVSDASGSVSIIDLAVPAVPW